MRKEYMASIFCSAWSAEPSSASSAEALAPVSVRSVVSYRAVWKGLRGHMRTEALASNRDHLAVGLVGDAVDLLEVVRVGDDLVIGEDILDTCCQHIVNIWRHGRGSRAGWCRRGLL